MKSADMKAILEQQIKELLTERSTGLDMIAKTGQELENHKMTVLRVEGAIAICRKLLAAVEPPPVVERNGHSAEEALENGR